MYLIIAKNPQRKWSKENNIYDRLNIRTTPEETIHVPKIPKGNEVRSMTFTCGGNDVNAIIVIMMITVHWRNSYHQLYDGE